jgi:hypothetical protein
MTRTGLLTEVIKAVAAADGKKPKEVDPLHHYVDPEILDKLDEMETKGDWRFTFQLRNYEVTVTDDSQVFLNGELYRSERSV